MKRSITILTMFLIVSLSALPAGCLETNASSVKTTAPVSSTTDAMPMTNSATNSPAFSQTTPSTGAAVTTVETAKPDLVGAYLVVIDHLITYKRLTAATSKYLAVDTTKLPGVTPADKARLFQGLEKYGFQLLDRTFDQLKTEGYIAKGLEFAEGAWIDLKDIRMDGTVMTLDAGIHLGGLNAYGLDDMRVAWKGARWEIAYIYWTWVA